MAVGPFDATEYNKRMKAIGQHVPSTGTTYYHLSPTTNRQAIVKLGLLPKKPKFMSNPTGVYLFSNWKVAKQWQEKAASARIEDLDLWSVSVGDITLYKDKGNGVEPCSWVSFQPLSVLGLRTMDGKWLTVLELIQENGLTNPGMAL